MLRFETAKAGLEVFLFALLVSANDLFQVEVFDRLEKAGLGASLLGMGECLLHVGLLVEAG